MLDYIPEISERYEFIEKIGEGGFAKVYKARNKITKILYALKITDKKDLEEGNKNDYLKKTL